MKNFTTNWYLYTSCNPKNTSPKNDASKVVTEETRNKLKLIERAIR